MIPKISIKDTIYTWQFNSTSSVFELQDSNSRVKVCVTSVFDMTQIDNQLRNQNVLTDGVRTAHEAYIRTLEA